jgi:hypothetical protein
VMMTEFVQEVVKELVPAPKAARRGLHQSPRTAAGAQARGRSAERLASPKSARGCSSLAALVVIRHES